MHFTYVSLGLWLSGKGPCVFQAVKAVNELNGMELSGRKILVREDREDRDVKQYNKDNGIAAPPRPPRREPRPAPPKREAPADNGNEGGSGLQVGVS